MTGFRDSRSLLKENTKTAVYLIPRPGEEAVLELTLTISFEEPVLFQTATEQSPVMQIAARLNNENSFPRAKIGGLFSAEKRGGEGNAGNRRCRMWKDSLGLIGSFFFHLISLT